MARMLGTFKSRILTGLMLVFAPVSGPATIVPSALAASDPTECRTVEGATARLRCYESLTAPDVSPAVPPGVLPPSPTSQNIGRWHLVRTPNPRGGKEAIAITHTGELSGSDPDFVGLMIRCGEPDLELLVVLLKPLSFRAHPRVTVNNTTYDASVVPPGSTVLLPNEASTQAKQRWSSLPSISFSVEEGGNVTKGLVTLEDFEAVLTALSTACLGRQQ